MPLHNGNLYNWFKPFSVPKNPKKKRQLSGNNHEEQRPVKRSPLNSPKENQSSEDKNETASQANRSTNSGQGSSQPTRSSQQPPPVSSRQAEPDQTSLILALDRTIVQTEPHLVTSTPTQDDTKSRILTIPSSQSVLTSSQRIVKNGEVMIRNSDDESFSDSSLEDMDDLLRRKPSREASPPPESQLPDVSSKKSVDGEAKRKMRKPARTEKPASPTPSTLPVMPRAYKYSLESLAKQRKQHEASEVGLARATSMLQSYNERKADKGQSSENKGTSEVDLINRVMKDHGEDDDASRLKTAIQRTEALQHGKSWSFFDNHSDTPLLVETDFPAVEDERLQPLLIKTTSREQAFVSGYVGEYAMKASLPEEILLWIMDEICLESRDDLRYSYTDVLRDASNQLSSLLNPERIDALFRKLGATAEGLNSEQPVTPRPVLSQSIEHISRPGLLSILDLLGSTASTLATDCRIRLFCILCRLALDHSIVRDWHAINAIGQLFSYLIDSIPEGDADHEFQTVLNTVFHSVRDASLRLQLLQMIPPLHLRLNLFRQRLALAFFFQDSRYLSKQPEDLVDLKSIADHLQPPQFTINNATDYAELAASIGILSIGIDCGNPPPPGSTKDDEIAFNSDIDILSSKIRVMFTQIIDTSASQMKRTEAKEILEAFHSRLRFAIRTRPPAKKSVFGDSHVKPLQERMEAFVMRGKRDDGPAVPNRVWSY